MADQQPKTIEELLRENAELTARLAAQSAGVQVSGDNSAAINTGQQTHIHSQGAVVQGSVTAGRDFIGRDAIQRISHSLFIEHYHAAEPGLNQEAVAQQVASYLRWLRDDCQSITLRGIETGGSQVVVLPLDQAYVPLRAKCQAHQARQDSQLKARRRQADPSEWEPEAEAGERDIALNQVLQLGRRLAIVGGPGSGKTTVLLHMAWALAASLIDGTNEPARSRLGLDLAAHALPLPIFVPLASYARHRRQLPAGAAADQKTLSHFISHHLIAADADFRLPADFFARLLDGGQDVILLLDGLDEVANDNERAEVRQAVERLVCGRPELRVIVTCRTIAYRSGRTALGADFQEIAVQPLDHAQHIEPMVRQAYACIHGHDPAQAQAKAQDLLAGILALEAERRARNREAAALVSSPLMVRLLLIVHVNNRKLPNERADLLEKAVYALLQADYGHEEAENNQLAAHWETHYEMDRHLAWHLHQQGEDQGREIDEAAVKRCFNSQPDFQPHLAYFLAQARQRGSLLEERDRSYRFLHLAFQEFLVSAYLREVIAPESRQALLDQLLPHLADPWWREPILLLAGYRPNKSSGPARQLLEKLANLGQSGEAAFAGAELAATAALEWHDSGEAIRALCARRIVDLLDDGAAQNASLPTSRARAGDALAQLGDPRGWLMDVDQMRFCAVPGGPFWMGQQGDEHAPLHLNDSLDQGYWLAQAPVTVAQLRQYLSATGRPPGCEDALGDPDNRPVRWVSSYEAQDFCAWLNLRWHDRLPPGWRITLPSEAEWEKAARGGLQLPAQARVIQIGSDLTLPLANTANPWPQRAWPWGDDADTNRLNAERNVGRTSPPGCFHLGASPYGCLDMAGNVWQWTRSLWGKNMEKPEFGYPYKPKDGREDLNAGPGIYKIVRGGSWSHPQDFARCTFHFGIPPDNCGHSLGFRVVLCFSPDFL